MQRVGARTGDRNDGGAWEAKLREAEDEVRLPAEGTPDQAWSKCRDLLRDAQAILRTDINYLRSEADAILLAALRYCKDTIFAAAQDAGRAVISSGKALSLSAQDLMDLKLAMDPGKISATLDAYAEQVHLSRRLQKQSGL